MMMITGASVPVVKETVSLSDAIIEISSKRLGATCVVDNTGLLCGILTDGDLRRLLQRTTDIKNLTVRPVMTTNPKTIDKNMLAVQALKVMETFKITQLIVVDDAHHPIGVLHLHDLVEAGLGGEPGT
jgi:arabinose-5-phosphate isomerase